MRVIITGAGEIGWYIAEKVSADNHDVTLIDKDENRIRKVSAELDVQPLLGEAASANVLIRAGVFETDLLVAVTGSDETNIVCGSLARKLGAKRVIARVDEVVYRKAPEISYRDHFGIDELVSPEMLAALELASSVRNPGSLAVEHFARGQLEMQRFTADQDAKNIGKPLLFPCPTASASAASIATGRSLSLAAKIRSHTRTSSPSSERPTMSLSPEKVLKPPTPSPEKSSSWAAAIPP